MLVRFAVENFLSFKERTELSLNSTVIKEHTSNVVDVNEKVNLLNGALLFGSNGSGKSNFIKAFNFVNIFVRNSFRDKQAYEKIGISPFLLGTNTENKPSSFEIEILTENHTVIYYLKLDNEKVIEERLCFLEKRRTKELFSRTINDESEYEYVISELFKKTDPINPKTVRANASLISVSSQFNGEISTSIINWFYMATVISGANYKQYIEYTAKLFEKDNRTKQVMKRILGMANLGFQGIKVESKPITKEMLNSLPPEIRDIMLGVKKDITKVKTIHHKYAPNGVQLNEVEFDLVENESLGSQKFFAMLGPIYKSLKHGSLLIIDELDARLHHHISSFILKLFLSKKNNPNNAQFIFTTHNSQFLDKNLLRRDQLYIVQKNEVEASTMYSIYDHESKLRNDASYDKEYLKGNLGGVPIDQTVLDELNIWEL